jgi:CxxC motif-containing protein (DUF1111 family)
MQLRLDSGRQLAAGADETIAVDLQHRGLDFGTVLVHPNGDLDVGGLRGISDDFTIRPFGHKGRHASLEPLVDEALQLHHGLQSEGRLEVYDEDGRREEFLGPGGPFDRDDDGLQAELSRGHSLLLASYLTMLGVPSQRLPSDPRLALLVAHGERVFERAGCGGCHRQSLRFYGYQVPLQGVGESELSYEIDLEMFGRDPVPAVVDFGEPAEGESAAGTALRAFTDLQRHDMGPELAEPFPERLPDGLSEVPGSVWQTRPLWGLADTAPYLHDGRAGDVDEAIRAHGGEGTAARDAYASASEHDRGALRAFLATLTRDGVLLVE